MSELINFVLLLPPWIPVVTFISNFALVMLTNYLFHHKSQWYGSLGIIVFCVTFLFTETVKAMNISDISKLDTLTASLIPVIQILTVVGITMLCFTGSGNKQNNNSNENTNGSE
jgi:hypothetical protein